MDEKLYSEKMIEPFIHILAAIVCILLVILERMTASYYNKHNTINKLTMRQFYFHFAQTLLALLILITFLALCQAD